MVSGKNESVNNAAIALRLVEIPSGRILWAGSASGRKVWRKDRFDELARAVTADLVAELAQIRTGVIASVVASLPEPEDGPGWAGQGKVYLESGLLDKAEEAFLKAETFPESQAQAYSGLGQVYARRPALRQRAIDYFNKALSTDSSRPEIYYHMAAVYRDIGTEQAVDFAHRAIALDSTYSAPYRLLAEWYSTGDWYATQQEDLAATYFYTRYLSLEPEDLDVAVPFGKVLLRSGDYPTLERVVLPYLQSHPEETTDLLPIAAQWAAAREQFEQ